MGLKVGSSINIETYFRLFKVPRSIDNTMQFKHNCISKSVTLVIFTFVAK